MVGGVVQVDLQHSVQHKEHSAEALEWPEAGLCLPNRVVWPPYKVVWPSNRVGHLDGISPDPHPTIQTLLHQLLQFSSEDLKSCQKTHKTIS